MNLRTWQLGAWLIGAIMLMTLGDSARPVSAELSAERWVSPLQRPLEVSGPYRPPVHSYASGHRGVDLPAIPGEPVRSPASGTVTFAGLVVDRGVISVRIDERTVVSIEPVSAEVFPGQQVRRGQRVGVVSVGGHCADECVHVGVRLTGLYVNPLRYLANHPVLLPWEG